MRIIITCAFVLNLTALIALAGDKIGVGLPILAYKMPGHYIRRRVIMYELELYLSLASKINLRWVTPLEVSAFHDH
ncbi:hypothetical protein DFP73DRAFT_548648 [Morchella snyderi]|nr:hypothetical protein DFP73DRAFT_548648 [Morchella snyderi]